jgi:2',3'-cyclic-nucleotide 2'-phosphodiesterase (5'-nucleotidase family)
MFKRQDLAIAIASTAVCLAAAFAMPDAHAQNAPAFNVKIIGFNDFHGADRPTTIYLPLPGLVRTT